LRTNKFVVSMPSGGETVRATSAMILIVVSAMMNP
jgi:hypothetical protein